MGLIMFKGGRNLQQRGEKEIYVGKVMKFMNWKKARWGAGINKRLRKKQSD